MTRIGKVRKKFARKFLVLAIKGKKGGGMWGAEQEDGGGTWNQNEDLKGYRV